MSILNDAQKVKISELETQLKAFMKPCKQFSDLTDLIDSSENEIIRAFRQFESSVMIVVSMGMLKAGKSTLVNLLARTNNASPVGYGVDTTLRPAIIRVANDEHRDGRILVYDFKHQFVNNEENLRIKEELDARKDLLGQLMDELRELPLKEGKRPLKYSSYSLTQNNLRGILCENPGNNLLTAEPLMVVVEVPKNSESLLLKENRMLLDMPGLDSANADVSLLSKKYEAIIAECDMMLFVQSSVAPLNNKASECLKNILSTRSSATAWVIQNIFLAKPWQTLQKQDEVKTNQQAHARSVINKIGGEFKIPPQFLYVNLGMAAGGLLDSEEEINSNEKFGDGTLITKEELIKRSEFKIVEEKLAEDIQRNGEYKRFLHCKDELDSKVKKNTQQFK